jgi:murein DD-endopeptidase MepM/ murein hydrolase activator NlpD
MQKTLKNLTFASLISMGLLIWLQAAAAANPSLPIGSWNPPLEAPVRLVNQYRQPNSDYSAGHRGVDYLVSIGQPILAPADGKVWFAGTVAQRPVLSIKHDGGYLTEFEPACTDLSAGEPVFAGQEIAVVCHGLSSYLSHCPKATCLHFSLRSPAKLQGGSEYLSPLLFIGGLNPSRLLPTLADERFYNRLEGAL